MLFLWIFSMRDMVKNQLSRKKRKLWCIGRYSIRRKAMSSQLHRAPPSVLAREQIKRSYVRPDSPALTKFLKIHLWIFLGKYCRIPLRLVLAGLSAHWSTDFAPVQALGSCFWYHQGEVLPGTEVAWNCTWKRSFAWSRRFACCSQQHGDFDAVIHSILLVWYWQNFQFALLCFTIFHNLVIVWGSSSFSSL